MKMQYENADKRLLEIEKEMVVSGETEEKDKAKSDSYSDRLVNMIEAKHTELFQDQFGEPHARIQVENHWEIWRIKSKNFKRWLSKIFWEAERKALNSNAIQGALCVLEGKAIFGGQTYILENRITAFNGLILYDLADKNWAVLEIGTEIRKNNYPPIVFKRHPHQKAQVIPNFEVGDIRAILPFINLARKEEELLFLVYIASCFIPDIPHPIPIIYGPQGAAKSTLGRMIRSLIDPSSVGLLSLPTSANELIQQLSHHWVAFYDNVTNMTEWASDTLCRAVTGEGFSKRELFTDDDDVIYSFKRCVGLNGINLAARKPDLLDRSILFRLERIEKSKRKPEKQIFLEFETAKPVILGGIFNSLIKAKQIHPSIQVTELPRMADFTLWGCAIAESLGATKEEFLEAYFSNIDHQNEEAILENVVANTIVLFMEDKDQWAGTPTELLELLEEVCENEKINTRQRSWPKAANALSKRLNEAKTNLAEVGIEIEDERKGGGKRIWRLNKIPKNTDTTVTIQQTEAVKEIFGDDVEDCPESDTAQTASQESERPDQMSVDSDDSDNNSGIPF